MSWRRGSPGVADAHILRRLTRDLEERVKNLEPPETLVEKFEPYLTASDLRRINTDRTRSSFP